MFEAFDTSPELLECDNWHQAPLVTRGGPAFSDAYDLGLGLEDCDLIGSPIPDVYERLGWANALRSIHVIHTTSMALNLSRVHVPFHRAPIQNDAIITFSKLAIAEAFAAVGTRINLVTAGQLGKIDVDSILAAMRLITQSLDDLQNSDLLSGSDSGQEAVRKTFDVHADKWRSESGHLSSPTLRRKHPSYLAILALGSDAIPHLLRALVDKPDYWFSALRELTGADPVADEDRGDYDAMTCAWLDWGIRNNLVESDVLSRLAPS